MESVPLRWNAVHRRDARRHFLSDLPAADGAPDRRRDDLGVHHPSLPRWTLYFRIPSRDGVQLSRLACRRTRVHDGWADRVLRLTGTRWKAVRQRVVSPRPVDAVSRYSRWPRVELGSARADSRSGGAQPTPAAAAVHAARVRGLRAVSRLQPIR